MNHRTLVFVTSTNTFGSTATGQSAYAEIALGELDGISTFGKKAVDRSESIRSAIDDHRYRAAPFANSAVKWNHAIAPRI